MTPTYPFEPQTGPAMHAHYQRKDALEAARLLRLLDPRVRAAVLKAWRDAESTAEAVDRAVRAYQTALEAICR